MTIPPTTFLCPKMDLHANPRRMTSGTPLISGSCVLNAFKVIRRPSLRNDPSNAQRPSARGDLERPNQSRCRRRSGLGKKSDASGYQNLGAVKCVIRIGVIRACPQSFKLEEPGFNRNRTNLDKPIGDLDGKRFIREQRRIRVNQRGSR